MSDLITWNDAFIGLGSNLDNPVQHILQAKQAIIALAQVEFVAFSHLYNSLPVGPQDQPNFVNAVIQIKTCLSAQTLLSTLQDIENQHGRVRKQHWGARTLDLDLLLYGNLVINDPNLLVPHPELPNRSFVLYPLADIAGKNLMIPGQGSLDELLAACPPDGLWRIQS